MINRWTVSAISLATVTGLALVIWYALSDRTPPPAPDRHQSTPVAADDLGDRAQVVIDADLGMHDDDAWRLRIAVAGTSLRFSADSLEGGLLRVDGQTYDVVESRARDGDTVELVVRREIGRRLRFEPGRTALVYEDDFVRPVGDLNGEPVLRVRPDDPMMRAYAKRYLGESDRAFTNRLADAFIEVDYGTLENHGGSLPKKNHWTADGRDWTNDPDVKLDGDVAHRGSRKLHGPLFWTSYLGIAYQHRADADLDPDVSVDGKRHDRGSESPDDLRRSPLGITGTVVAGSPVVRRVSNSFLFVETIWDSFEAHAQLAADDPQRARVTGPDVLLGRSAIQEVGRQFGLPSSNGIMHPQPQTVEEREFQFRAEDLKTIRLSKQPGSVR